MPAHLAVVFSRLLLRRRLLFFSHIGLIADSIESLTEMTRTLIYRDVVSSQLSVTTSCIPLFPACGNDASDALLIIACKWPFPIEWFLIFCNIYLLCVSSLDVCAVVTEKLLHATFSVCVCTERMCVVILSVLSAFFHVGAGNIRWAVRLALVFVLESCLNNVCRWFEQIS